MRFYKVQLLCPKHDKVLHLHFSIEEVMHMLTTLNNFIKPSAGVVYKQFYIRVVTVDAFPAKP